MIEPIYLKHNKKDICKISILNDEHGKAVNILIYGDTDNTFTIPNHGDNPYSIYNFSNALLEFIMDKVDISDLPTWIEFIGKFLSMLIEESNDTTPKIVTS